MNAQDYMEKLLSSDLAKQLSHDMPQHELGSAEFVESVVLVGYDHCMCITCKTIRALKWKRSYDNMKEAMENGTIDRACKTIRQISDAARQSPINPLTGNPN